MLRCKTFNILFRILPFKSWQSRILEGHVESCPFCRGDLIDRTEARDLFRRELPVDDEREIWPFIRQEILIENRDSSPISKTKPRWVLGSAAACAALVLVVWFGVLGLRTRGGAGGGGTEGFLINSISVGGEPATTFFYQPNDSEMIFVWAEKEL